MWPSAVLPAPRAEQSSGEESDAKGAAVMLHVMLMGGNSETWSLPVTSASSFVSECVSSSLWDQCLQKNPQHFNLAPVPCPDFSDWGGPSGAITSHTRSCLRGKNGQLMHFVSEMLCRQLIKVAIRGETWEKTASVNLNQWQHQIHSETNVSKLKYQPP